MCHALWGNITETNPGRLETSNLSKMVDGGPKTTLNVEDMSPNGFVDLELADYGVLALGEKIGEVGNLADKIDKIGARPIGDELVAECTTIEISADVLWIQG